MRDPAHPLNDGESDPVLDPEGPPLRRPGVPNILGPLPTSGRGDGERDAGDESGRYRRPERPAPAPSDARSAVPPDAADPFAESPLAGDEASALAAPGRAGTRVIAEPLAALAMAFQANADALRRSQDIQADLGRALQRADRSEVLLQSTGALNDTFRGLTTVQKGLLQRIDAGEKAAKEGRWFLPILVLSAMAVLGALGWLLVRRMDEIEGDRVTVGAAAEQFNRGREEAQRD